MSRGTGTTAALLLAGALLVGTVAGCAGAGPADDGADPSSQSTPDPTDSAVPLDPDVADEPPAETGAEPPLPPRDVGPTLTIAGLPAGGGSAELVDGAWCGVITVSQGPPEGVELVVTTIRTDPPGLETPALRCQDVPPCLSATLDGGESSCAIAVVPPEGSELVHAALDVRVECADEDVCAWYVDSVEPGFWWDLPRPAGVEPEPDPQEEP